MLFALQFWGEMLAPPLFSMQGSGEPNCWLAVTIEGMNDLGPVSAVVFSSPPILPNSLLFTFFPPLEIIKMKPGRIGCD